MDIDRHDSYASERAARLAYARQLDADITARRNRVLAQARSSGNTPTLAFPMEAQSQTKRYGGGGEPLRRNDGSVVSNLRTLERTRNPNIPIPTPGQVEGQLSARREEWELRRGGEQMDTEAWMSPIKAQHQMQQHHHQTPQHQDNNTYQDSHQDSHQDSPNSTEPAHHFGLRNPFHDSPENLSALSIKRRAQQEMARVLQQQVFERKKREAAEREKDRRADAEWERKNKSLLENESPASSITGSYRGRVKQPSMELELPTAQAYHGAMDHIMESPEVDESSLGQSPGLDQHLHGLLDSPLHAQMHLKKHLGFGGSDAGSIHSLEVADAAITENNVLRTNQLSLLTKQSELLESVEKKSEEILRLEAELKGVRDGRMLFWEETAGKQQQQQKADASVPFLSPVKSLKEQARKNREEEWYGGVDLEQELGGSSEYYPLTSQPTAYGVSSITYGSTNVINQSPMVVSSGLLQSNFGLTSVDKKMGNGKAFEHRREEALEAFLRTFQMTTGAGGEPL